MSGKGVNRDSLERLLGSGQPYAIAQVSGLKAALGWSCGCRAIEHDGGVFTLISCGQHQGSAHSSATMLTFQ